ncbi:MAG: oxygen-independent coproporphyrinogen III oxidase [bacterium]
MSSLDLNLELLSKYDRPGPRYTSYPTAPHFAESFGADSFYDEIIRTNQCEPGARGLSLYFHLPFCDTLCYFCGCNMIITHNPRRIDQYLDHLEREIAGVSALLSPARKVEQLHWGGGTPTYLAPDQIARLGRCIHEHFSFTDGAELSVEIDPRGLERAHLEALRAAGFNRASLGVQDFNHDVQRAVNRVQSFAETNWTLETLRALGFNSINLDLIYGLPFQTEETFTATLQTILTMQADRLAVFNYAHVPWIKKHQSAIPEDKLPGPEMKLRMLKRTIEMLLGAGYVYIGMDHFAKPEDELATAQRQGKLHRNFQGYSTHAHCDLYAFGVTGISMLENVYAQNLKELGHYYKRVSTGQLATMRGYRLSADDRLRRYVINRLMCDMRLELPLVSAAFEVDFKDYFAPALESLRDLEADGLMEMDDTQITISPLGRLLIRNVAMAFDAYLPQHQTRSLFSRTV